MRVIFFGERADWAGQREFGFFRKMSPGASLDKLYFYWSTKPNCGNATENPNTALLASEYFLPTEITGLTPGTTYYLVAYLFWANWDSTYKSRVEVWDSTYSSPITAFNVGTSSGGVNYG
jgi:hypothetical protein